MACFWLNKKATIITIPSVEEIDSVTYYKINVKIGDYNWSVLHRYSEFFDLHNVLVNDHGVSKDILPPKKVIYNKLPSFIEQRRNKLEVYLQSVLNYLKRTMPWVFVTFLDFHEYDIFFVLQNLSFKFYNEADSILTSSKSYTFNPLELHAISECLKKPFPEVEQIDERFNFSHILDFCLQLNHLSITGASLNYKTSSINLNALSFEMSSFKYLECLEVASVDLDNMYSVGNLRNCLLKFIVNETICTSISQILQCDVLHKSTIETNQIWSKITEIDFSRNNLMEIDDSIQLIPLVQVLKLDHNKITTIPNLTQLTQLIHLSLSDNLITISDDLHTKLGNIEYLNLSQNNITTLKPFSKLYSLESLDLSCNKLCDVEDIVNLSQLPCIENLMLTGNLVATIVDYRVKVLEHLTLRAEFICLDNERPNQQELDKAALLRALRIFNQGKNSTQTTSIKSNSFKLSL